MFIGTTLYSSYPLPLKFLFYFTSPKAEFPSIQLSTRSLMKVTMAIPAGLNPDGCPDVLDVVK